MERKDEIYLRLIEIAEKTGEILREMDYDLDAAEQDEQYAGLKAEERKLLLEVRNMEYRKIIENSFLFAYDETKGSNNPESPD